MNLKMTYNKPLPEHIFHIDFYAYEQNNENDTSHLYLSPKTSGGYKRNRASLLSFIKIFAR